MPDSVDKRIVSALDPILHVWNVIKEKENEEVTDSYYAFNYSTHGIGYADDDPTAELAIIQVHLIAPLNENITSLIKQTKRALHDAGFTWAEVIDASDAWGRHKIFEFQDVEGVDLDGDL